MFELNPLDQAGAWWQHLVMVGVAALIGYIIGYRTSQGVAAGLEEELAELEDQLDACRQAPVPSVVSMPIVESPPFVAPEPIGGGGTRQGRLNSSGRASNKRNTCTR